MFTACSTTHTPPRFGFWIEQGVWNNNEYVLKSIARWFLILCLFQHVHVRFLGIRNGLRVRPCTNIRASSLCQVTLIDLNAGVETHDGFDASDKPSVTGLPVARSMNYVPSTMPWSSAS